MMENLEKRTCMYPTTGQSIGREIQSGQKPSRAEAYIRSADEYLKNHVMAMDWEESSVASETYPNRKDEET